MRNELIVFDERAFIKEKFDALASGEFVACMLLVDTGLSTSHEGLGLDFIEALAESLFLQGGEHSHGRLLGHTQGGSGCGGQGSEHRRSLRRKHDVASKQRLHD